MGLTHLRAARAIRGGKLLALVTSDPRKARGDFSRVGGNFGAGGSREDLSGITVYPTIDEMLADDRVDLVDVCLPSYLHADAAVRVLSTGRSVLVEKPVALSVPDATRIVRTGRRHGGLVMVAQVLKFFPEFLALEKLVQSERYGKLLALHHRRIIAKPAWSDDNWLSDPERSGGMHVDLHIHDTDFIVHLFGPPAAVRSSGLVRDRQEIDAIRTSYEYPGGPLVTSEANWICAPALPFEQGYDAYFEKATIQFNSTTCPNPRVFGKKEAKDLTLPKVPDAFQAELQAAVASVRSGEVDPRLRVESATLSLAVCAAEARSVDTGRRVAVRPPKW